MKKQLLIVLWSMLLCTCSVWGSSGIPFNTDKPFGIMGAGDLEESKFLRTNVNFSDLMNGGQQGMATIEYWGVFFNENYITSSESITNSDFFIGLNQTDFKLKYGGTEYTIPIGSGFGDMSDGNSTYWNHYCYTFESIENNKLRISFYKMGFKRGTIEVEKTADLPEMLYHQISPGYSCRLTDLRYWSHLRDYSTVKDYTFTSFTHTPEEVFHEMREYNGLVASFSEFNFTESGPDNNLHIKWYNSVPRSNIEFAEIYLPKENKVSSFEGQENLVHYTLKNFDVGYGTDFYNNTFLRSNPGKYDDQIELKWIHKAKTNAYKIYRNNRHVGTLAKADFNGAYETQPLSWIDDIVKPGQLYTYQVRAIDAEGNYIHDNESVNSFASYNGRIEGNIKTTAGIYVEDMEVTAASDGDRLGSAINFAANSEVIKIDNVDILRDVKNLGVEFYHRNDGRNGNTVLKLDDIKVIISPSNVIVTKNGGAWVQSNFNCGSDWHHYAIHLRENATELYIDGNLAASNANANTKIAASTKEIILNEESYAEYTIDELKFWDLAEADRAIAERYNHISNIDEAGLLLYYRFDLNFGKNIYNEALVSRGDYQGVWQKEGNVSLNWITANDQPDVKYGTYTDKGGNYVLNGINYDSNSSGHSFIIDPYKANHNDIDPEFQLVTLRYGNDNDYYEKDRINFTDLSELPVSGRVFYVQNGEKFPVPMGQTLLRDGQTFQGDGSNAATDATGLYSITAPLGKHVIEVNNAERIRTFGTRSLAFDGVNDYVESKKLMSFENLTFSTFIMTKDLQGNDVPLEQYIAQFGELSLVLNNNTNIELRKGDQVLLNSAFSISPNTWNFIGFTIDNTNNKIQLRVGDDYNADISTPYIDLNAYLYLGAKFDIGETSKYFRGNMDHLMLFNVAYDENNLTKVKDGEIIETQEEDLYALYPFNEDEGIRTISITNEALRNYLILRGNVSRDEQLFYTYAQKYKYNYEAVNSSLAISDNGYSYEPNIIMPITGMDFENTTRYGITGNIIIPCGQSIGRWTGKIIRTDIAGDPYTVYFEDDDFNNNFTVFKINDLMPGQYRIELTPDAVPTKKLTSTIIDLRSGWTSYDFHWENPLNIETRFIRKVTVKNPETETYTRISQNCEDMWILEKATYYDLEVQSYQLYDDERCYISNFEYTLNGDMLKTAPKNEGDEEGEYVMPEAGIDTIRTLALNPNFIDPFFRSLNFACNYKGTGYNIKTKAYITGVQQYGTDFTLNPPDEILMVLHDPAGDGSSISWNTGSSLTFDMNWDVSGGTDISFDVSTGMDQEWYQGTWVGLGGGAVIMNKVVFSQVQGKFNTSHNIGAGIHGSKSYNVSLNQSISTDSGDEICGYPQDVYVGTSQVIHVGVGKKFEMLDECTPNVYETNVATPSVTSMFAHSHSHIQSVIIPNLESIRADKERTGDTEGVAEYNNKIAKWEEILLDNETVIENIADHPSMTLSNGLAGEQTLIDRYNWSAGAPTSWTIAKSNSNGLGGHENYSGDISTDFNSEFTVFGANVHLKTGLKVFWSQSFTGTNTNTEEESFTVSLSDDDSGDQFDMMIKQDPRFGSPIFKTMAGRSMCPFELGTVPREGVEIIAEQNHVFANPGSPAVFNLTLRNTQAIMNDQGPMHYALMMAHENAPAGAKITYNGVALNKKIFNMTPGQVSEVQINIEPIAGAVETTFERIPIVFFSDCEVKSDAVYNGNAWANEVGISLADTVYLTAEFHTNCVENVEMVQPANNWIVNRESGNNLTFQFHLEQPASTFTKLLVEYAMEGNNEALPLLEISKDDIIANTDGEGYVFMNIDMSALPEGAYNLRLTPMCGAGYETWRKMTPSEWVYGNIRRSAPLVSYTSPGQNGILTTGSININYDREIQEAQVNSLNVSLRGNIPGISYLPKACIFNTSVDEIIIPEYEGLDMDTCYTVDFWIKPNAIPTVEVPILEKGDNYRISLTTDGRINNMRCTSSPIIPGRWTHVSSTYNGDGKVQIYIDGELDTEITNAAPFATNDKALIIAGNKSGNSFIGLLDEVHLWNTARMDVEFLANRKSMLLGNEKGLQLYLPMDDNALEGEGIRDFTGKASGTSSNEISFTSSASEAAPINLDGIIHDIPINAVLTNGNQIQIIPMTPYDDWKLLEGGILTASVVDNKIRDPYGNKAKGKSWTFTVNKNALSWVSSNKQLTASAGTNKTFTAELHNYGGASIDFRIEELPGWIKMKGEYHLNTTYAIAPGASAEITFETAAWLNSGKHSAFIKSWTESGYESFLLELNVNCLSPSYAVDPYAFPFNMNLCAEVTIDGQLSEDEGDQVIAFINDEPRGVGNVSYIASIDKYLVQMQVYHTDFNGGDIEFRIWDASTCKEYMGIVESYEFSDRPQGTIENPIQLTTEGILLKRLPVSKGYPWISFNLHDDQSDILSVSNIRGAANGDYIKDKTNKKATFNGSEWTGNLTQIDPQQSYIAHFANSSVLEFFGRPCDINQNINIDASPAKNWIGYLPDYLMSLSEGMISLSSTSLSDNDQISAKGAFAQYYNGEWTGSLTHMAPGQGYQINTVNSGTLNYVGIASQARTKAAAKVQLSAPMVKIVKEAQKQGYKANLEQFAYQMHFNGEIISNHAQHLRPQILLALIKNQVVGVAVPQEINGKIHYYLSVGANQSEELSFRLIEAESGRMFEIENHTNFKSNAVEGTPDFPYEFIVGEEILMDAQDDILYQNMPNPVENETSISYYLANNSTVKLVITSALGQIVDVVVNENQKAGKYTYTWKNNVNLQSGVYIINLVTANGNISKQMIIK